MSCAVDGCNGPVNYSYKDRLAAPRSGQQIEVVRMRSRYCQKHEKQRNGQHVVPPPRLLLTQQALRALER